LYQNTLLQPVFHAHGQFAGAMLYGNQADAIRRVYNNLILYFANPDDSYRTHPDYPVFSGRGLAGDIVTDGNLYWHIGKQDQVPEGYLDAVRNDPMSLASKEAGKAPDGWAAHSLVADPRL